MNMIQSINTSELTTPITAYVTEKHESGKERTWGVELVTATSLKIRDGGYFWLGTMPPDDLDYDCPASCWNTASFRSKATARKWFLDKYKEGGEGAVDGWTIIRVRVEE
jgi:hypothetical protein